MIPKAYLARLSIASGEIIAYLDDEGVFLRKLLKKSCVRKIVINS